MAIYKVTVIGHGLNRGDLLFGGDYFQRNGMTQVRLKAYDELGIDKGFIYLPINWVINNTVISMPELNRTSEKEKATLLVPLGYETPLGIMGAPPRKPNRTQKVVDKTSRKCFENLLYRFNRLHENSHQPPDSRQVAALVGEITNDEVILLLQHLKNDEHARETSRRLARRSDLFDKLILIIGTGDNYWVLRLHTYQIRRGGGLVSNLGNELQDDEANTHFHRWQLGSRFVTGGFNNVTWNVNNPTTHNPVNAINNHIEMTTDKSETGVSIQRTYTIPATKNTTGKNREATHIGNAIVTQRRSEFYMRGDVVSYPIVDAHSVSASLSPFVGTTMTLAHTGKSQSPDSYFFKPISSEDLASVPQIPYKEDEFLLAIDIAMTRLQLVNLNHYLWQNFGLICFSHMNAFETELLPRIAELLTMHFTAGWMFSFYDWVAAARKVDLDEEALFLIATMDTRSLVSLLLESQDALISQDFVSDLTLLVGVIQESQALRKRLEEKPINVL
jgi:hypothetical protein